MRVSKQILVLFICAIVVSSCDSSVIYEEQIDLEGQTWHKDSAISYFYEADTIISKVVGFSFNVRYNIDYAYRNMWLFVKIKTPGREEKLDTINLEFMDFQGNWKEGVEGGTIKEYKHYYDYGLPKPPKGVYKIELRQGMRDENLKNVVSVGARIEKLVSE
ncbi:MAG: gliding motility-associated lipoprotein GldH [Glaciecola sp.]|jgi:gliding motility-associated lipoprotein GldH